MASSLYKGFEMIERKSIVDQIEIPSGGGVQVRIALMLVEDGKVLSSKWHRTLIPAEISAAEQLAYVNGHLSFMGEAQLSSMDMQRVGLFHKLAGDMPSENAPVKTIDETVAALKDAKASVVVEGT
jgi:hypothetical protein